MLKSKLNNISIYYSENYIDVLSKITQSIGKRKCVNSKQEDKNDNEYERERVINGTGYSVEDYNTYRVFELGYVDKKTCEKKYGREYIISNDHKTLVIKGKGKSALIKIGNIADEIIKIRKVNKYNGVGVVKGKSSTYKIIKHSNT